LPTVIARRSSGGLPFQANRLIDRDKVSPTGHESVAEDRFGQALPTVTGFGAMRAFAALRKHNVCMAPLLRRAGLSERDFDNQQHPISAAAQFKLFECVAEAIDDSAFGLRLAEQANPRAAGLLFYVMSAANDVGEALALFARYSRIVNEALHVKLVRASEGAAVETGFVGLSRYSAKQATEFGVALTIKALREIAGRNVHPTQVTFIHGRNSELRSFERFFRCPVEFGASRDQFAFSQETLALPLITEDQYLLETLRPLCDVAAKERRTPVGTLRAKVETEVQKLLPHGKAGKQNVARTLGLSERTLARRLADEDTTYEQVVDQLRRSLAREYVRAPGVSFSQMAWLLGYEGTSSFNHAFRRWTGRSPSEVRNEKLLPTPV
jgi:AraC-like DNA-binding protein